VEKGNALIFKSGGGGDGTALYKDGGPVSTAIVNRVFKIFVVVSKMETSGGEGDAGWGVVGMMLE
jgi:hypothetical protein